MKAPDREQANRGILSEMTVSSRARAGWLAGLGFVVALAGGRPAVAQVTQTDAAKTPLPQPVGAAELSLVNQTYAWNANTMVNRDPMGVNLNPTVRYGDFYARPTYPQFETGDAINLSGLFKWRKETIDPMKDAKTGPGYFSAQSGFTGQLVLMGGNCQAQFGWYNVTDPASKTPPLASEVYPFITGKPQDQLNCVEANGVTRKTDGFCPLAWDNRGPYDLSKTRWTPKAFSSGDISKDPRYKGAYVAFALIGDPQRCPQNKYSMYEHNQRNASGEPWVTTLIYRSTVHPGGFYLAFEDLPMSPADWRKSTGSAAGADGDFNDFVFYVSGLTSVGGNQPCSAGCASGWTCGNDGYCVDAACVGKQCLSGQSCLLGACVDPCAGVLCPGNDVCSNGACVAPPTGAGGSAGSAGALSFGGSSSAEAGMGGLGDAGEAAAGAASSGGAAGADDDAGGTTSAGSRNDGGGATAAGGASAAGGAVTPSALPEKSSSCGYAILAPGQSLRAWSVLGLVFGLALMRRRRRTL